MSFVMTNGAALAKLREELRVCFFSWISMDFLSQNSCPLWVYKNFYFWQKVSKIQISYIFYNLWSQKDNFMWQKIIRFLKKMWNQKSHGTRGNTVVEILNTRISRLDFHEKNNIKGVRSDPGLARIFKKSRVVSENSYKFLHNQSKFSGPTLADQLGGPQFMELPTNISTSCHDFRGADGKKKSQKKSIMSVGPLHVLPLFSCLFSTTSFPHFSTRLSVFPSVYPIIQCLVEAHEMGWAPVNWL